MSSFFGAPRIERTLGSMSIAAAASSTLAVASS